MSDLRAAVERVLQAQEEDMYRLWNKLQRRYSVEDKVEMSRLRKIVNDLRDALACED